MQKPVTGFFRERIFNGMATLLPDALSIHWELQFKQYYTRTMTATLTNSTIATQVESGWDGGDVYYSEGYATSGAQELNSTDSPSQVLNINSMYNNGVRSGTFSDIFNLYFYGKS